MKLPSYKRIYDTDFPDNQDLVRDLSSPINTSFENVHQALDKNISLTDNIAGTLKIFTISVDSSGTPSQRLVLSMGSTQKIAGTMVIRAENTKDRTSYPDGMPFVSFTQEGDTLTVTNITGLKSGITYQLTLFAFRE